MDGLEKEYGSRIAFQRVNILNEKNQPLMEAYGFSATPELYLVDGEGRVMMFWDDVAGPDEIRQVLDAALQEIAVTD